MSDLTVEDIKSKIEKVKKDIEGLRLTGESSRKLEVMNEYLLYLEDELKMEEHAIRSRTSAQR